MATEATADQSVETIVPSDSEPSNKTPNDLNDVASHAPDVNGSAAASTDELEHKQISDIVDDLVNSAEVSISGGSDTEASKLDGLKGKDGDKGHGRTSSSVKKPATFKAVSVNKTFLAAKGAAGTAATKTADKSPLSASLTVAQPGSLSAARPRLVAKTGSGHSLPKAVGANGRAPAAPDPNAVWNKNRPAPPPEPKKFTDEELKKYGIHMASRLHPDDSKGQANWADIEDDDEDWAPEEIRWNDGTKSTIPHHEEQPAPTPEPPASSVSRELKTADKPKSPAPTASPSVKPGVLASGKGLVLKGHQDKPTLVAKPPAPPTPVKSPWATLPPVDKAPPPIDLPGQHHPMRPPPREHHMQYGDGMLGPYKEIAADDFSRSGFRDGHAAHGRELFNSHSGRLEPVMDRRGGVRSEAHGRQPPAALLQRPSQSDHPEPSAAFQTSRTSAQEGPYGRRRGSSNVSGGSGHVFSRMGKPHDQALPPPELLSARRASTAAGSDDMSSPRNFSPSGQRQPMHGLPAWQTRMSPNVTHATPFTGHQMAQNENNAHLPGQQLPPAVPVEDALEVQKRVMRERREMAIKRRLEEEAREEAAKQERLRVKLEALGPAPERKSTKKEVSNENTLKDASRSHSKSSDAETAEMQSTPHQPRSMQPSASAESNSDTLPDGAKPHGQHQPIHPPGLADSVHAAQESKAAPGWQSQGERLPTWAPASQPSSRNVWGSPNNNRSLGNGTFNADLGRVPDAFTGPAPQVHSKPTPGPIGPPGSQKQSMAPIQPIGPPNANAVRNAWSSAVRDRDSTLFAERQAARAEQQRDMEARGLSAQDLKTSIKDNWKPTKLNDEGIRIEERERSTVIHAAAPWKTSDDATTVTQAQSHGLQHTPPIGPNGPGPVPQQGRASRFFPTRDVRLEEQAARADRSGRNSPSPPPPDMFGHPVFDGDAARPHVALPPPQIVVRLPKTQAAHTHNAEWATQQAPRGLPPRGPMREAHMQHEGLYQPNQAHAVPHPDNPWQARIDHLLDRKPSSPPKSASVDSVSRVVDHRAYQQYPATVSLPFSFSKNLDQGVDGSVTSKVMAEECFEEQEMGSLPSVRLGTDYPPHLDEAIEAPKPLPRRFLLTTSTSLDQDQLLRDGFGPQHIAPIRLPGSPTAKSVTIPVPRSRSNPRRPGGYSRGGMRHSSAAVHRGGKSREPSSSYGEGTTGSSGRGRGGYRGRSDNWSRHVSSPLQT